MKISIITVNYNDKTGLEKTINSVVNQVFLDFEYIIIDGNSSDGSKELIQSFAEKLTYWVSEKDSGIYSAMNKGIKASNGDYVLFLNSGDYLVNNQVIQYLVNNMNDTKDLYYGDAIFKYKTGDEVYKYPDKLSFNFFRINSLCHQTCLIRRKLFDEIFYYNENFKIISDWEFMIYSICVKNISYKHLNNVISYYDYGGISSNPESKDLIKKETDIVMNTYFSGFIEDYNTMDVLNIKTEELNSKRIKNILYIKKFSIAWKLLKGFSNMLILFLPKQK